MTHELPLKFVCNFLSDTNSAIEFIKPFEINILQKKQFVIRDQRMNAFQCFTVNFYSFLLTTDGGFYRESIDKIDKMPLFGNVVFRVLLSYRRNLIYFPFFILSLK